MLFPGISVSNRLTTLSVDIASLLIGFPAICSSSDFNLKNSGFSLKLLLLAVTVHCGISGNLITFPSGR